MKYLATTIVACLASTLPIRVAAQSLPNECPDSGLMGNYVVFTTTVQISMLEYICGEIAPDTKPAFDRVLGRYRDEAPTCYAASRQIPELRRLPKSPEALSLIADYRSGVMPKERREMLLNNCTTIESSDKRARDERDQFMKLLQQSPVVPSGG
jgi:hypothetical protein